MSELENKPPYRSILGTHLRNLTARAQVARATAGQRAIDARDFERHLRDQRAARRRNTSRSQKLFGKGAVAEKLGYLDISDEAILGLEAHGTLYATFVAQAASETEATDRGTILRYIFSCPRRLEWCEKEGARISMEFSKAADEQRTREFNKRQAKNPSRSWRKDSITEFQEYRIKAIELRLEIKAPAFSSRGAAHDWIAVHVANPDFWRIPKELPPWTE
ncbi:hypothetical protein WJT74_01180 [Sphingomicrobium sp. XHP0239]|uniref:hypothetical protein n=1 Tax=Sphingomicrobium maritimum TaxID=3133972 RepID=UPI0031CC4CF0